VARVIAAELSSRTGQPVVVDNKPGAEGQIGAQAAATAPPDGYTIFVTTQTTQAINQHVYKSLPYDPVKSFAPLSGLSRGAQGIGRRAFGRVAIGEVPRNQTGIVVQSLAIDVLHRFGDAAMNHAVARLARFAVGDFHCQRVVEGKT